MGDMQGGLGLSRMIERLMISVHKKEKKGDQSRSSTTIVVLPSVSEQLPRPFKPDASVGPLSPHARFNPNI